MHQTGEEYRVVCVLIESERARLVSLWLLACLLLQIIISDPLEGFVVDGIFPAFEADRRVEFFELSSDEGGR